ncbi:hypothetical protein ALC56_09816 [Trachymyrmex septentrionalis]|uniref:Uncharacterized protein n=1 Tax=Trachymyrmex septentrionalis TaxID=34720 RepID=A0A151JUM8_9HYME|nr:hypothetical protein ALC56_09816 [Trachymyrmex septentrionalis]
MEIIDESSLSGGVSGKIRSVEASENAGDGDRGEGEELAEPVMTRTMEAIRPWLGDSDVENPRGTSGTLGLGVSALRGRFLNQLL